MIRDRSYWWTAAIGTMISCPICEAIAWIEGWTWIPAVTYAFLFSGGVTLIVSIWRGE